MAVGGDEHVLLNVPRSSRGTRPTPVGVQQKACARSSWLTECKAESSTDAQQTESPEKSSPKDRREHGAINERGPINVK